MCACLIQYTVNRVTCLETDQSWLKKILVMFQCFRCTCMLQILNASCALGKDVNLKEFHILSGEAEYYGRVWHNDVQLQGSARTVLVPVLIAIVVCAHFSWRRCLIFLLSSLLPVLLAAVWSCHVPATSVSPTYTCHPKEFFLVIPLCRSCCKVLHLERQGLLLSFFRQYGPSNLNGNTFVIFPSDL